MLNIVKIGGKMTLTFDRERYKKLLCQYQPKVIKNEAENEVALKIVEQLMHNRNRTPEEDELYDLLVVLVEKFEQEHYKPGATSTPLSMLHFLMEQQEIEEQDLIPLFGSKDTLKKVIQGQTDITPDQARALSSLFDVDLSLFL